mmetsp:Transcript_89997/g.188156  ORF Transcript_89997/g.188156 Transcript_89997/m.188156 type:complete len:555 (+) Transcript_89997:162-1826(+)
MTMPMSGRQRASPTSLGLYSLLASVTVSVAERVHLSPGRGCNEIVSRAACCMFLDGRSDTPYGGQECVPTSDGAFFNDENEVVCEPACFVGGTCGDKGDDVADLSARAGLCLGERKPVAAGCFNIMDRETCCEYRDAREDPTFSGQDCVPSKPDVAFVEAYGNVCEPQCWVDGSCNEDQDIASKAGTCQAPAPAPSTTSADAATPTKEQENLNTTRTSPTTKTMLRRAYTNQNLGEQYLEQINATVPAGGDVSFFIIASSNGAYMTWPDQLHATLKGMGYSVSVPEPTYPGWIAHPRKKPICLDDADYADLATPRFGMTGWASWGFAFDDQEDCDDEGYRPLLEYNISCINAAVCNPRWSYPGVPYLSAAKLAETFKGMTFVVLSNWINDARMVTRRDIDSTPITSYTISKLVNKIHEKDPKVVVLVLARYPGARETDVEPYSLKMVARLNAGVKAAVQHLPNTYFVDVPFPLQVNMFQTLKPGHPNCRGDKLFVNAIIETLYDKQVLSRGLAMAGQECLSRTNCEDLPYACCHKSALCYVKDGKCSQYTPGLQ